MNSTHTVLTLLREINWLTDFRDLLHTDQKYIELIEIILHWINYAQ